MNLRLLELALPSLFHRLGASEPRELQDRNLRDAVCSTAERIQSLQQLKKFYKLEKGLKISGAVLLCFTFVGLPVALQIFNNCMDEQAVERIDQEIWILENIPDAMEQASLKYEAVKALKNVSFWEEELLLQDEHYDDLELRNHRREEIFRQLNQARDELERTKCEIKKKMQAPI